MSKPDWTKYKGVNGNTRRIRSLASRFDRIYGPFIAKTKRDPLDELILTVLSQNTNDRNSGQAFENLKRAFPTWRDVLDAPIAELREAIRVGGLAGNKSRSIKGILKELVRRNGDFNLDYLDSLALDQALENLVSLPGVGFKTASCVMLFSFGRPSMPVDTHVHRLSMRLGLVREKSTPEQAYRVLMAITPAEMVYPFHLDLIQHGRTTCKAQKPRCGECIVRSLCPWPDKAELDSKRKKS
jgi:endonuclease-3